MPDDLRAAYPHAIKISSRGWMVRDEVFGATYPYAIKYRLQILASETMPDDMRAAAPLPALSIPAPHYR